MNIYIRDPQFASFIDEAASSIEWPDVAFTVTAWEALVGVAVAFYEAFATPERATLHYALKGIAF